jgi:simple sugar transport system ATP-binding protein
VKLANETNTDAFSAPAVELRGISKVYPGAVKKANSSISLELHRGEILCIAGENGAGKTTLMKILDGLEAPSEGEIRVNGIIVTIDSPLAARKLGIGMVHQNFMLFSEYTAAENIVMGMEPLKWGFLFDSARANAEAAKVIDAHHFSITPDKPVKTLSIGEMQQVEICRLLYRNADIIILDEPSSVLTEHETAALFKTLRALATAGKSIFLITHKLHEIKAVADRVAVLRRGELAGIHEAHDVDEYEIARLMIGDNKNYFHMENRKKSEGNGKPVIVFDNVTVLMQGQRRPLLNQVSFEARSGEIVGFAGVGGNGLGVLEAVLGGFLHSSAGKITHNGNDVSSLGIRRLRNQGLAYVPANRQQVGSALNATVDENLMIDRRRAFSRMGFLDTGAIRDFSDGLISRYNIEGATGNNPAASLSGGNLQKLVLAREIDQFRDYFIFSEPTWSLDIVASSFIWSQIAALRGKGAAIILISTNLDEILALADRIIVMFRGSTIAEFDNCVDNAIKEKIGNCMQGLLSVNQQAENGKTAQAK